eukprot:GHVS01052269.1.p1 GENE.GHVS01052269.1~~GHVS01052269.1.p1  ORF type:complete len:394 (-),score=113.19 GHVS01052269.1:57-1238(-)
MGRAFCIFSSTEIASKLQHRCVMFCLFFPALPPPSSISVDLPSSADNISIDLEADGVNGGTGNSDGGNSDGVNHGTGNSDGGNSDGVNGGTGNSDGGNSDGVNGRTGNSDTGSSGTENGDINDSGKGNVTGNGNAESCWRNGGGGSFLFERRQQLKELNERKLKLEKEMEEAEKEEEEQRKEEQQLEDEIKRKSGDCYLLKRKVQHLIAMRRRRAGQMETKNKQDCCPPPEEVASKLNEMYEDMFAEIERQKELIANLQLSRQLCDDPPTCALPSTSPRHPFDLPPASLFSLRKQTQRKSPCNSSMFPEDRCLDSSMFPEEEEEPPADASQMAEDDATMRRQRREEGRMEEQEEPRVQEGKRKRMEEERTEQKRDISEKLNLGVLEEMMRTIF